VDPDMRDVQGRLGGVEPFMEIQREIDAMKVVYTQEWGQLERLVQEVDDEVQRLRSQAKVLRGQDVDSQVPRQVWWRLEHLKPEWSCVRECFPVEECPLVDFTILLCRREGDRSALTGASCRLELQVAGPATEGLRLSVSLSIGVVAPSEDFTSGGPRLTVSEELRGSGSIVCDTVLPDDLSDKVVVCCAELMVLSWDADTFLFESVWMEPRGIAQPEDVLHLESVWQGGVASEDSSDDD